MVGRPIKLLLIARHLLLLLAQSRQLQMLLLQQLQLLQLPDGLLLRAQSLLQRLREERVYLQLLLKHERARIGGWQFAEHGAQFENEQQFASESVRDGLLGDGRVV